MGRFTKFIVFTPLIWLLAGCSVLSIGLHFGEYLLARTVDDMFDLDRDQMRSAKELIRLEFEWARREVFPKISDELAQYASVAEAGALSRDDFANKVLALKRLADSVVEHGVERAALILSTVRADQSDAWKEWHDERGEWLADMRDAPPEKRAKMSQKRIRHRIEFWLDEALDAQVSRVHETTDLSNTGIKKIEMQRNETYTLIADGIMSQLSAQEWEAKLRAMWFNPEQVYSKEAADNLMKHRASYQEKPWVVLQLATNSQRSFLAHRLRSVAGVIRQNTL